MELQAGSITNIMTDLNKANYDWNYKLIEGINLIHYRNMIYMLKTLQKLFFKWYNYCLQHPGGNRLAHTLTNICRWAGIFGQEGKIFRTFQDSHKFKKRNFTQENVKRFKHDYNVVHYIYIISEGNYHRLEGKN